MTSKIQYYDNYIDFYKNRSNIYKAYMVLVKNPDKEKTYFVEKDRSGTYKNGQLVTEEDIVEFLLFT